MVVIFYTSGANGTHSLPATPRNLKTRFIQNGLLGLEISFLIRGLLYDCYWFTMKDLFEGPILANQGS